MRHARSSVSSLRNQILSSLLTRSRLTRNELLRELDVRPATLLQAIAELSRRKLVHEPLRNGRSTGRRASPIELDSNWGVFLGLELDVQQVVGVCIDTQGRPVARIQFSSPEPLDADAARRLLSDALKELRRQTPAAWDRLRGATLADPGIVDSTAGVSLKAVNLPGWEQFPSRQWLHEQTGCAASVIPAALARAYAESVAAGAASTASLFHLQADSGIGGGFIKNGEFFLGDSYCAMEIGHVVVREDGPQCQCGNRGCLEAVAGLSGLRRQIDELARHGVITSLTARPFSMPHLLQSVQDGDKVACALAADACEAIGVALAALVCILNPADIVLSGQLIGLGPTMLEGIRRVLARRCLPQALAGLTLRLSTLDVEGTALGAALVARKDALACALD